MSGRADLAPAPAPAIAVVAPEPVSWLGPVVQAAARRGPVVVLAPWRLPTAIADLLGRLPIRWHRLSGFVQRRSLPLATATAVQECVSVPGWEVAEALLRGWAGRRVDRSIRARFAARRLIDAWVARWLTRMARPPRLVLTPSLAAQHTLAAAGQRGVRSVLLEDVPGLRDLHRDLDRALIAHPECRFLGRFRASDRTLVQQEVERSLADHVAVRGRFAWARYRRSDGADVHGLRPAGSTDPGDPGDRVVALPAAPVVAQARARREVRDGSVRILLAGLAAARHGTVEALASLRERPRIELVVRTGEGMEPAALTAHPRVRAASRAQLTELAGIDAVIAPSWCESYPRELSLARVLGVPTIATERAAGFARPCHEIPPGDAKALGRALDRVVVQVLTEAPRAPSRPSPNWSDTVCPPLSAALDRALS